MNESSNLIAPVLNRRTFYSLQAGRGIAAIMVVLFHIGNFVGNDPGLWHRSGVYRLFHGGMYGVDFFFILSGIVMLSAHWADIGQPHRIRRYFWKRFRRIYPIYWVFLIPTVVKQLRVTGTHGLEQRNPFVILSSFLLVHLHSLGVNLVVSWTLFHEVLFYLIFSTLLLNRKVGTILCAAWFAGSCFFFTHAAFEVQTSTYFQMFFSPLHLLFAFGMLVGWILQGGRGPASRSIIALGLSIYVGFLLLQVRYTTLSPVLRILAGAGLALALVSIAEREARWNLHIPRWLTLLGDASYSIYLTHFLVVWSLSIACFRLDRHLHLSISLWILVLFATATAVGIVTHLWIERPLLKLLGDRRPPKMNVSLSQGRKALDLLEVTVPRTLESRKPAP